VPMEGLCRVCALRRRLTYHSNLENAWAAGELGRHLAQRRNRRTSQTITDRLRPLTPWNHSSSEASPLTAEVRGSVKNSV
jgi:hypothetical protein